MTADAKQQQIDFIEAQGLAVDMMRLTVGRKIGVISHAYAMLLGTFAASLEGHDPHVIITQLTDAAHFHADQAPAKPTRN